MSTATATDRAGRTVHQDFPFWPVLVLARDEEQCALSARALDLRHPAFPDRNRPPVVLWRALPADRPVVIYKDWRDVPDFVRTTLRVDERGAPVRIDMVSTAGHVAKREAMKRH